MRAWVRMRATARAVVLALAMMPIGVAPVARADDVALIAEIRKLAERVGKLEQRNGDLERRLDAARATETRLTALAVPDDSYAIVAQARYPLSVPLPLAALTFGAEVGGDCWGRAADALGLAAGFLRTSNDYREATADGPLAGYAASGSERIAELHYRLRIDHRFDLTPDVQWIQRPGGDGSAPDVLVGGVRATVGF